MNRIPTAFNTPQNQGKILRFAESLRKIDPFNSLVPAFSKAKAFRAWLTETIVLSDQMDSELRRWMRREYSSIFGALFRDNELRNDRFWCECPFEELSFLTVKVAEIQNRCLTITFIFAAKGNAMGPRIKGAFVSNFSMLSEGMSPRANLLMEAYDYDFIASRGSEILRAFGVHPDGPIYNLLTKGKFDSDPEDPFEFEPYEVEFLKNFEIPEEARDARVEGTDWKVLPFEVSVVTRELFESNRKSGAYVESDPLANEASEFYRLAFEVREDIFKAAELKAEREVARVMEELDKAIVEHSRAISAVELERELLKRAKENLK